MSHTCKALVLHCIDFRFHSAIRDYLKSLHLLDSYDMVSVAGASKGLAQHEEEEKIILKQIDISKQLHGITEVYLIHHMDCGAYGGHAAFASEVEEAQAQIQDMHDSRKEIQIAHPDVAIYCILANIKEEGKRRKITFSEIK